MVWTILPLDSKLAGGKEAIVKVIIFGATGLVGRGVLSECLDHPGISKVLCIGRRSSGVSHAKLQEIRHMEFTDYTDIAKNLEGFDACFWCLGISSFGMDERSYHRITYEYTMEAAKNLVQANPELCFCFVSGEGTDDTEQGRSMWARVKGRTENALKEIGFRKLFLFRPGFIAGTKGTDPRRPITRMAYRVISPLARAFNMQTSNGEIGRAMIAVAQGEDSPQVIPTRIINQLASKR